MIATVAWLAGFVALAIAAARVTRAARQTPGEIVERGPIAIAALAALALGLAAAWVWTPAMGPRDAAGHARLFVRAIASPAVPTAKTSIRSWPRGSSASA